MTVESIRHILTIIGIMMCLPLLHNFWMYVIWYRVKYWFLYAAVSYVPEEMSPRWLLLWHAREDWRVCRYLGEDIQSRYTIARENARYL